MLMRLLRHFAETLRESSKASSRSMVVAGAVGAAVYIGYGILWLYVTPVEHESLALRSVAVLLCLAVAFSPKWPERFKGLVPWAWFAAVTYALPFYATYQLLGSNYSVLRSMLMVTMVFFVAVIFPHYLLALTTMAVGIGLGALAGWLTIPSFETLNHGIVRSVHVQAMLYSIVAGLLFTRSNLKSILARQRIDTLEDLAGSIAHEVRNPLTQLRYRLESIGRNLPRPTAQGRDLTITSRELDAVYDELAKGRAAIERGLQMIAMTLDEIHAKPLDPSKLRVVSAEQLTRKALDEFGYESDAHRARVSLRVEQDFPFEVDETRYVFVLFNLLKNAVHYFDAHPASRIRITVGGHRVVFEDTGPGIHPDVLARLFQSYHTSGKAGGTGLGLSFCKRTMVAFGGDITSESELGRYTRFILEFPPVVAGAADAREQQVLQRAATVLADMRVLVVDDMPALRKSARAMLEPLGAMVHEAENGQQALEMLARTRFGAMVLDLSMPVLDGYSTAEAVRSGRVPGMARLPIVAYTAESAAAARAKLERVGVHALVQKPCSQAELAESLCQAVELGRRAAETDAAAEALAGKTILLVDDEPFSRGYLRALMEQRGIEVLEASDGAAALRVLEAVCVDAVITDIYMPVLDGIGFARAVQASHVEPKPLLLALSARDDESALATAREAGIRDFIAKPADAGELFAKLDRHLGQSAPAPRPAFVSHGGRLPAGTGNDLLDVARLETLRRVGMIGDAVPEAVETSRALLQQLQEPVARRDLEGTKELLHSLVGICGTMGSNTLHQHLRSLYVQLAERQQWPGPGWHEELLHLHARTAMAIQERYLAPEGQDAG